MKNIQIGDKLAYVKNEHHGGWVEVAVTKHRVPFFSRWYKTTVSNGESFDGNGNLWSDPDSYKRLMTIEKAKATQARRDRNDNLEWGVTMCGEGWY